MNDIPPTNIISLELPAVYKYLHVIGACIRAILERKNASYESRNEWIAYQVELAVQEACSNIIEHAYAGSPGHIKVTFSMREDEKHLAIDLYDTGARFDPSHLAPINLEEPRTSGYGLFLMHQLMEKITYQPQPEGNHWRLEKEL